MFVVMLHESEPEANEKLRARIEERFPSPQSYKFSDHVYLLAGPKLIEQVDDALGLRDDHELSAAILRLRGSYGGRSWRNMWDWFQAMEEAR